MSDAQLQTWIEDPEPEVRGRAVAALAQRLRVYRDEAPSCLPLMMREVELYGAQAESLPRLPWAGRALRPWLPALRARLDGETLAAGAADFLHDDALDAWHPKLREIACIDATAYAPHASLSQGEVMRRVRRAENEHNHRGRVGYDRTWVDAVCLAPTLPHDVHVRWLSGALASKTYATSPVLHMALELIEAMGPGSRDLLPAMRRAHASRERTFSIGFGFWLADDLFVERLGALLERVEAL